MVAFSVFLYFIFIVLILDDYDKINPQNCDVTFRNVEHQLDSTFISFYLQRCCAVQCEDDRLAHHAVLNQSKMVNRYFLSSDDYSHTTEHETRVYIMYSNMTTTTAGGNAEYFHIKT